MGMVRRFGGCRRCGGAASEVFAEVDVPQAVGATLGGFGIHPVLLDAALHALGVDDEQAQTLLPFSWQGVSLHAAGASRARVCIGAGWRRGGVGGDGRRVGIAGVVGSVVGHASGIGRAVVGGRGSSRSAGASWKCLVASTAAAQRYW